MALGSPFAFPAIQKSRHFVDTPTVPNSIHAVAWDMPKILSNAFNQAELEYLNRKQEFRTAAAHLSSLDELEALCALGENLLQQIERPSSSR